MRPVHQHLITRLEAWDGQLLLSRWTLPACQIVFEGTSTIRKRSSVRDGVQTVSLVLFSVERARGCYQRMTSH